VSTLSEFLKKAGVPVALLDGIQKILDSTTGQLHDQVGQIVLELQKKWGALLPTPESLVASVKGQTAFKQVYKALTAEQKAGVDAALLAAMTAALVKVRKALGLGG
jgi:hypothetical protein